MVDFRKSLFQEVILGRESGRDWTLPDRAKGT